MILSQLAPHRLAVAPEPPLPLAGLLGMLTLANLVFHLSVLGVFELSPVRALYAALALIVLIECVMAGRVIPAFTMNAIPGLRLKVDPSMEVSCLINALSGRGAMQRDRWRGRSTR